MEEDGEEGERQTDSGGGGVRTTPVPGVTRPGLGAESSSAGAGAWSDALLQLACSETTQDNTALYSKMQCNATALSNTMQTEAAQHNPIQRNVTAWEYKGTNICTHLYRTVYLQPRSSYCLRATQKFVPRVCT